MKREGTRTPHPSCNRAGNIPSIPGLLYGANESIAHTTPIGDNPRNHPPVQMFGMAAAAGPASLSSH